MDTQQLYSLTEKIVSNPELLNNPTIMAALKALTDQSAAPAPNPPQTFSPPSRQVEREPDTTGAPAARMCPPLSDLTLLQATFFDNWRDGKIPNTPRFGITFEGWTVPVDEIRIKKPQWKNNVLLINHNGFPRRLAGWRAPTKKNPEPQVDDEYGDFLHQIWDASPAFHFGLFGHREGGFHYLKMNFAMMIVEENVPGKLELICFNEDVSLANWATRTSQDKPLAGFATHQSRLDIIGKYKDGWAT